MMKVRQFNRLLGRIKQEDSFNQIYQEFYPLVIKYSNYIFSGKNLGKDIAQEIFTYLLTHDNLPYVRNPNAWVFTLCKNIGLKYVDKVVQPNENDTKFTLTAEYDFGELSEAVENLTAEEQEIVNQKYLFGFTLKEIAVMLNKPYTAVLKQHYRILKKLQKFLSENPNK